MATSAYFEFTCDADHSTFIIELIAPEQIKRAREILGGPDKKRYMVIGEIVKTKAPYNPRWSYHLAPATIDFAETAIEVCDATPSYAEEHLSEAGGAFLPGLRWCPWCSRLSKEISPP